MIKLRNMLLISLMLMVFVSCGENRQPSGIKPEKEGPVLFPVKIAGKYGYIDKLGNLIIETQFDYALAFSEGLAAVRVGDEKQAKWGYIDKSGKYVIAPQFDGAESFSGGLAMVRIGDKQGYIDKEGTWVWKPSR